jgi:hypothetical protein
MRKKLNGRLDWASLGRTGPLLGGGGGGQGGFPVAGQQGQGDPNQGQQNQGQQGQGNQGGQGQGDQFGDLFADITGTGNAGGDQNQQGQGQGQGGQGQQGQGTPVTLESIQQLLQQQASATQAEIDRRINGAFNTFGQRSRRRQGGNGGGQGQNQNQNQNQGQQGQGQGNQQFQQPLSGAVDGNGTPLLDVDQLQMGLDQREARSAFREYVGEEIKFISADEREHANLLGTQLLARMGDVVDPDTAGREIARQVASKVKNLRDHYKNVTIEALRRKGLLNEQAGTGFAAPGGGSAPAGVLPSVPVGTSGVSGVHVRAAQEMAQQYNQRNGHQVQQTGANAK